MGLFQHESDLHNHFVGHNAITLHLYLLFLYPRPADIPQRGRRTLDTLLDGIFKALLGSGTDLGYSCNGHNAPLGWSIAYQLLLHPLPSPIEFDTEREFMNAEMAGEENGFERVRF
jgi:hypothetical protein